MTKLNLILLLALCATGVIPSDSISRWFSASYHDLRVTMHRYSLCASDLQPLKDNSLNEIDYLVDRAKVFLDQTNFDNEHLANISALMDNICRLDMDNNYPISVYIDVNKYSNSNPTGKENRCRAVDEALDAMYPVFKRVAFNRSEPLDFGSIQFYPDPRNRTASYNLTDLINTSWIKSETILEHVCRITGTVKDYVRMRSSNATAQDRTQVQSTGVLRTILDFINRILDPLLGLQSRFYWEGNNRLEVGYNRVSGAFGSIRDGFGSRIKSTRTRIAGLFNSTTTNSTQPLAPSLAINDTITRPTANATPLNQTVELDKNSTTSAASVMNRQ